MRKARLKIAGTIVLLLLIAAGILAVVTYGGGLLWDAIQPGPTVTSSPTPSAMPSQTASPTETATLTRTATSIPAPTDTTAPTDAPSVTSTATASPTPTDTPTATRTRGKTATPTPKRPTNTPEPVYLAPTLLEPKDGVQLAGLQRFTWQWNGPSLGEDHAFDLRIWSFQEDQEEKPRRGAATPTQDTEIEVALSYVPAIADYGPGDYYWTVVVVKVGAGGIPQVVGEWGEKRRFTYAGPSAPTSPTAIQPTPSTPPPTPITPSPTPATFPTSTPETAGDDWLRDSHSTDSQ